MLSTELTSVTKQWKAISDRQEQLDFYRSQLFPVLQTVVIPRERQKLPTKCIYLIMPVGLSPEPLVLSIQILDPQRVYFLYTPGPEGSEQYLDWIVQKSGLKISQIDKDAIDETNVPEIYRKVKEIYFRWGKPDPHQLVVDITFGKKSMVSACTLAGSLIGAQLTYLDSQFVRDFNKPEPGSEHLVFLANPYDVFGDLKYNRAVDLYRQFDFAGAVRILGELKNETSTPEQYEARSLLCEAYAAWDDWRLADALLLMQQVLQRVEVYSNVNLQTPLFDRLAFLRIQVNVLGRLQQFLQMELNIAGPDLELLNRPDLFQPMIGTFRACAMRLEHRGKLDSAILLWYRLLELLEQQRLSRYTISCNKADYSRSGFEIASLTDAFERAFKETKQKHGFTAALPEEIDMVNGYALLKALKDPLVEDIPLGEFRGLSNLRNKSLFAHGFKPIASQQYGKFKQLVGNLLEKFKQIEPDCLIDWDACQFIEVL